MVFLFAAGMLVPLLSRDTICAVFGFPPVGLVTRPHGAARYVETAPSHSWRAADNVEMPSGGF